MKVTSYKAGTPCWVDLGVADVMAAVAFYGDLLGWTGEPGPPETGGYVLCQLSGVPVAGIGPLMMEGQPAAWTTYLASDDMDDTAIRVTAAGGQSLSPIMDIMTLGRMSVFLDSTGAAFGSWQKGDFVGAGVVNEPGSTGLERAADAGCGRRDAVLRSRVRPRCGRKATHPARSRTRSGRWTARPSAG